jgi:FlaA1/EpsC-like NDP-sugar epimerase
MFGISERRLILWGAGRNGKDLAKLLLEQEKSFHWVCDNERKVGKDIYGILMEHFSMIPEISNPQIIIVVTSPKEKAAIAQQLEDWGKKAAKDFWFFV